MTSGSDDLRSERRAVGLESRAIAGTRAMHSSDASPYAFRPKRWCARGVDDVLAALSIGCGHGVPVTARGAGTSVAGTPSGRASRSTSPAISIA